MKYGSFNICNKHATQLIAVFGLLLALLGSGCSVPVPKLTAEDRKKDIQFMADWARDISPFVELAQKHKGIPDYEALLPKYLEYAAQAESNADFYQVVSEYIKLMSAGHGGLIGEDELRIARIAILLGIIDVDIKFSELTNAIYWPRLAGRLSTRAHPPFGITYEDDKYLTDDDWEAEDVTVPRGSQIVKVNGMSCSTYLDFIKENTTLRYDAYPKDWADNYLLIIDEGEDFKGWQVEFLLPDESTHSAFVPKIHGFPAPKKEKIQTVESKENCTCIELTDEVAYIRIKSMEPDMLSAVFWSLLKKDGEIIKTFLDNANGKYRKLIIDVRNNSGGIPYYFYENLIRPFLDESVTYDQVAGIRRKYRDDLKKSDLKALRKYVSGKKVNVVSTEEINPPEGFDPNDWFFYRITRRIEPRNQYNFDGSLYVLINWGSFSASDDYANAVKRIGFAKLVGRNTSGGGAAYLGPTAMRLPASGMIFRVETELLINPDGSVNELFGTPPDIQLELADPPKSVNKEDLLKDEWIQYIIHEL